MFQNTVNMTETRNVMYLSLINKHINANIANQR